MNNALQTMIDKYNPQNNIERENAIKEVIQEIVLAGLSRGGFFKKAVFYGGTCLRIFYGLDRFSEDLDFALIDKNNFDLNSYLPFVKKELISFGLDLDVSLKEKNIKANIESAFVKGNELQLMLHFFPKSNEAKKVISNQRIKIKFEIDVSNPEGGTTKTEYRLLPSPYEIRTFDESTLFGGKMAAVLCRSYQNNVKGRDYYDYLFYLSRNTKFNLKYLENKLKINNTLSNDECLTIEKVKIMLEKKFNEVNFNYAKDDVKRFIKNIDSLDVWSKELFISTLKDLRC